jgi:hypothetical protein
LREVDMRWLRFAAVIGLAVVAGSSSAQQSIARATLASAFDLDGEAADADQIVTAANGDLTDAKTFTLTADPDVCRLVDATVTDANSSISAGVLTVVGVGCLSDAKSCTFTFAAGGSGVKTLTCADGQGAYFSDVTSVTTDTLTGEGGAGVDLMTLGYTSGSVNGWAMYGKKNPTGPNGELSVDPFGYFDVSRPVTTSAVSSATLTGVNGGDDALDAVAVGDLIILQTAGTSYERKVTAKASADSITLSSAVTIPAAGVAYRYKKAYFSTNPAHLLAVPVSGYRSAKFTWSVDANANTGGVITLFECTSERVEFPTAHWEALNTTTVASGAAQVDVSEAVSLEALPYTFCRFGFRIGTGDDADAAAEDIGLTVDLLR